MRPAVGGLFSFRQYDAGTGLCCPLAAAFSLSAKDTFQRPPATRWTGIFQNFFCLSNPGNRILATGGAENFSFHSLHHRVLKFAKHQGRKIPPSLTTTPGEGQNGRVVKWTTKKQQIFFKTYCFHCPPVGGWYSVWNMVRGGQHSLLSAP